jgi:hypothetical protein
MCVVQISFSCAYHSLHFAFELFSCAGKGTSSKDGSALCGALLEHLDRMSISGIFATHLHEMFDLPLALRTVVDKKMGCSVDEEGEVQWSYELQDGRCTDSMALVTAKKYGIDANIIARAEELSNLFDSACRLNVTTSGIKASMSVVEVAGGVGDVIGVMRDIETCAGSNNDEAGSVLVKRNHSKYHLSSDVSPIMRLIGASDISDVHIVPASWEPPVALEGSSCVYVLQLYSLTKVCMEFLVIACVFFILLVLALI